MDRVILGFVAACVGWLAGAAIGALALLADRYRDAPSRGPQPGAAGRPGTAGRPGAQGQPGAAYLIAMGIPGIVIVLALVLRLSAT